VTDLEQCSVDSNSSGLCPVDSGSLWLVIIPKSKDCFVDQPPMETVQPLDYVGTTWHSMRYRLVWCTNQWSGYIVDSLLIRLVGNEWVKVWTPLRTTRCKRGPLVVWTDTSSETLEVAL
jgi:hypothetical protein